MASFDVEIQTSLATLLQRLYIWFYCLIDLVDRVQISFRASKPHWKQALNNARGNIVQILRWSSHCHMHICSTYFNPHFTEQTFNSISELYGLTKVKRMDGLDTFNWNCENDDKGIHCSILQCTIGIFSAGIGIEKTLLWKLSHHLFVWKMFVNC